MKMAPFNQMIEGLFNLNNTAIFRGNFDQTAKCRGNAYSSF
jgi:hypothetical protein